MDSDSESNSNGDSDGDENDNSNGDGNNNSDSNKNSDSKYKVTSERLNSSKDDCEYKVMKYISKDDERIGKVCAKLCIVYNLFLAF
jgi:hypothetical protein